MKSKCCNKNCAWKYFFLLSQYWANIILYCKWVLYHLQSENVLYWSPVFTGNAINFFQFLVMLHLECSWLLIFVLMILAGNFWKTFFQCVKQPQRSFPGLDMYHISSRSFSNLERMLCVLADWFGNLEWKPVYRTQYCDMKQNFSDIRMTLIELNEAISKAERNTSVSPFPKLLYSEESVRELLQNQDEQFPPHQKQGK